jgi:predicted HAD superfamily phosphohydrolase YqeG
MRLKQLHALLPDQTESALSRALEHDNVRAAVKDLDETLKHITLYQAIPHARADWEATRDELLTEIRMLTARINNEP